MFIQSFTGYTEPTELIYNPNNEETPLKIKLFKNDTKHYKQAFREYSNAKFEAVQNPENVKDEIDGIKYLKDELSNDMYFDFISSLCQSWDGMKDFNTKEDIEFSKEIFKETMMSSIEFASAVISFIEQKEGKSTKKQVKTL